MEFLGFLVDSQALTLALPRDKIRRVKKECQNLLDLQVVTVRELAKVLGHLTSTIQAVFPAPLHFRHLQECKNKALGLSHKYEHPFKLTIQAKEELVWWRDNLDAWNGKALVSGSSDAFTQDWSKVRGYAFPPFALVGRCLKKLLDQSVPF
jgi:hypothetical protein